MYLLPVPPFVELKVATTDEEVWQLRRHDVVVKPPLGGTPRRNLDEVVEQWRQEVILANTRDPSLELSRIDDVGPLSTSAITRAAEGIIERFDGIINPDDVFYLVYPQTISRLAAGIRNTLQVAGWPKTREWEINGVLYRQKKPYRYWLPMPGFSTYDQVKLAFCQSSFFLDEDGPNGWRLLKHSSTQPILQWYVSPDEPAFQGEGTFAVANTFEVEAKAFAVLQDAVEQSGTSIQDVHDHPNEKNGFPDYKAVIGTQPWAIEIVRPLGDIGIITMGTEQSSSDVRKAASRPGLGLEAIGDGLRKATKDKAKRRKHLAQNEQYCLLLVDTMGLVDPEDPNQWDGCELDAFDSVILVQLMPERPTEVAMIKGHILLNTAVQPPGVNGGASEGPVNLPDQAQNGGR